MDKEQLIEGVNTMLRVTEEIFAAQRAGDETKKRLRNNDHTDNDDAWRLMQMFMDTETLSLKLQEIFCFLLLLFSGWQHHSRMETISAHICT